MANETWEYAEYALKYESHRSATNDKTNRRYIDIYVETLKREKNHKKENFTT